MSVNSAKQRVELFLTAAAAKAKKPKAKTPPKVKAKNPGEFHDKMDAKLAGLAKKHDVSINMRRNKKKLPTIVIGRLKNKKFGNVVKLFSAISNTSPVPQKLSENGASFRVFGPRKISASEDQQFVVKAKKDGKTVYMTANGWTDKKSEADVLGEETADKIIRRHNAKGDSSEGPANWDVEKIGNKLESDDGEADNFEDTEDDSGDTETEDSEDDSGDEEDTSEDDENVANLLKLIEDNGIDRSAVNEVFDKAMQIYADDLKNNGPVDDAVGFIYDTLGPDDALVAIKTLVNKASLNKAEGGV